MSEQNVAAVRDLFERVAEIEFERVREVLGASSSLAEAAPRLGELGEWHLRRLHPEVEIDASAMPAIPEGNVFHGHQGWFEFWRSWMSAWETFEYEPGRWHDAGDRVAVELLQRGRLRSGLEYATPMSNVWTFDGDKVVRLQMFLTWEEAIEGDRVAATVLPATRRLRLPRWKARLLRCAREGSEPQGSERSRPRSPPRATWSAARTRPGPWRAGANDLACHRGQPVEPPKPSMRSPAAWKPIRVCFARTR
jgi:ketosteroid isomerase-like protein